MKRILQVLMLVLVSLSVGVCQFHHQPYTGLLEYQFPHLTSYPPVILGMPTDVSLAYFYCDFEARTKSLKWDDSITKNATYSDSLRQAAKYIYELVDYDPVLYYQWCTTSPSAHYYRAAGPGIYPIKLCQRMLQVYPDTGRAATICTADYIADVIVDHTVEGIDTTAILAQHGVKVSCVVLDTIKGKHLPDCISDYIYSNKNKINRGNHTTTVGGCLQFEYALEWTRVNPVFKLAGQVDSNLGNYSTGVRWVQPDSEYIVFLQFVMTGTDSNYTYTACYPYPGCTKVFGMYPVKSGKVYDPYNDFGFGVGLTVAQFKAALRQKIYSITHP